MASDVFAWLDAEEAVDAQYLQVRHTAARRAQFCRTEVSGVRGAPQGLGFRVMV
jgi:hypothetical protein